MTRERTVLAIGLHVQVIVPQAEIDHELPGVAEFMIVVQPTNVMFWHYSLFIGYFTSFKLQMSWWQSFLGGRPGPENVWRHSS